MCILFLYTNSKDLDSDYSLILASNRDEFYDRPTLNMGPWEEDCNIYGGRDLQAGGTWLALSLLMKKLGVLLNLPGAPKQGANSRGKIVSEFVKSGKETEEYITSMNDYIDNCNGFVLATIDIGNVHPSIKVYCNADRNRIISNDGYQVLGNCLPTKPLKKVEAGKEKFSEICSRLRKIDKKDQLIEELLILLKSDDRHLPDQQLEERQPNLFKELSSIYVHIPNVKYGTRTHTLILLSKTGHMDVIDMNLITPIDPNNLQWDMIKYEFEL